MHEEKVKHQAGKKWDTPRLTVLTRGKNEESVLMACKSSDVGENPAGFNIGCNGTTSEANCSTCSDITSS